MNIDELERLARTWSDQPTVVNRTTFSNAANPAAILELVDRVRKLEFALNHIASWSGVSAGLKTFKDVRAYAKYNANYTGESNE